MAINWNIIRSQPDYFARAQQGVALGEEIRRHVDNKKMEGVAERLTELMADPDFNLTANTEFSTLMAQRPDLAELAMQRFNMMSKARDKEYREDMTSARDAILSGDEEYGLKVLAERIARVTQRGGVPDDAIRLFRLYQLDKGGFVDGANQALVSKFGDEFLADQSKGDKKTANIRDYEYWQGLLEAGKTDEALQFANKSGLSRLTPQEQARLETESAQKREQNKARTQRLTGFATTGVDAADQLAGIQRTMELLKTVETGGFEQAALAAKRFFGIDAGDEGELSFRLGTNVLGQLRQIFGAAFTAEEGKRLESISANYGRSPAANMQILRETFKITKRAAERGMRAAKDIGDDFTANEIKVALDSAQQMINNIKENGFSAGIDINYSGNNTAGAQAGAMNLQGDDQRAYEWAQANPQDPRAQAILQRLGINQ